MKVRRRKRSSISRLARFWIAGLVLLMVCIVLATVVARLPQFAISAVRITPSLHTGVGQIRTAANIRLGGNIWLTNLQAAQARVERLPWVESARIKRRLPGDIRITVIEREPVAVVSAAGGGHFLIDATLRILAKTTDAPQLPELDLRVGPQPVVGLLFAPASKGLADLAVLSRNGLAVKRLAFERYGDLRISLLQGPQVLLASGEALETGAKLVRPLIAQASKAARRVRTIDVRAPEAPVFQY